jgi:hypothetical protein
MTPRCAGAGWRFYPKLPYDPIRDFALIILYAMVPNLLVVLPSLPAKARSRAGRE